MPIALTLLLVSSAVALEVDFYPEPSLAGEKVTLQLLKNCVLLPRSIRGNVSSVETNDGCVHLCEGYNCDQECITIDPFQAGVCKSFADISQCNFAPSRVNSVVGC